MEELSVEEKAKAYDEAFERAKNEYQAHTSFKGFRAKLVHIFPQLKENEDEEMRKTLIAYFKKFSEIDNIEPSEINPKRAIAWLEKQGEQKSAAWSEEDVAMFDAAITFVEHSPFSIMRKSKNDVTAWLKSLKDRAQPQPKQQWKPTESQLASLEIAYDRNDPIGFERRELLKELKKLV